MIENWKQKEQRLNREWHENKAANEQKLAAQRAADRPSVSTPQTFGNLAYGKSLRAGRYEINEEPQQTNLPEKQLRSTYASVVALGPQDLSPNIRDRSPDSLRSIQKREREAEAAELTRRQKADLNRQLEAQRVAEAHRIDNIRNQELKERHARELADARRKQAAEFGQKFDEQTMLDAVQGLDIPSTKKVLAIAKGLVNNGPVNPVILSVALDRFKEEQRQQQTDLALLEHKKSLRSGHISLNPQTNDWEKIGPMPSDGPIYKIVEDK